MGGTDYNWMRKCKGSLFVIWVGTRFGPGFDEYTGHNKEKHAWKYLSNRMSTFTPPKMVELPKEGLCGRCKDQHFDLLPPLFSSSSMTGRVTTSRTFGMISPHLTVALPPCAMPTATGVATSASLYPSSLPSLVNIPSLQPSSRPRSPPLFGWQNPPPIICSYGSGHV